MTGEGTAIVLWYGCVLLMVGAVITESSVAVVSSIAAMICTTVLVKSYRKER